MNGAYTNGYRGTSPRRREFGNAPANASTEPESLRERRPGGYGNFGPAQPRAAGRRLYGQQSQSNTATPQFSVGSSRPAVPDRQRAPRQRSRSRGRDDVAEGQAARDIEDILHYMQRDWTFMTEDKCVPVQVALRLLDDSSLGLGARYDEFQGAQTQLKDALRAIVNEHHQGFNSAIGMFHQIQTSIQQSHDRVRMLKTSLLEAKSNLSTAKPEFLQLSAQSRQYQDMLDVLATIEHVQQLPEKLEASISEKRFLTAVDLLQDALKMIRRPELEDIGALGETRIYLTNQEHSLVDILVEELHNHLYLKSPYCEDRWQAYAPHAAAAAAAAASQDRLTSQMARQRMYEFLDRLDASKPLNDDASRNPESDSFQYILMISEALNRLNRLVDAVGTIEDRLPVELFKVVERSNGEIQQRHPKSLRIDWTRKPGALQLPTDAREDAPILNDLLESLYAKFEAIAESHCVFHEIVSGISSRESTYSSTQLTMSFRELWKLYQSEMRSLLHDYISTRGTIAERMRKDAADVNIFRYQRDKTKKTPFKLDLVDTSASDIRSEREDVVLTWQRFVPGIASLSQAADASSKLVNGINNHEGSSAAGHKLLVEPSVFNIIHLLPPSVSFLNRLKDIVPASSNVAISTLSTFLNEFLVNVFHPQLEETLEDYCSQSFTQLDAFQQDAHWEVYARRPIYKGTIAFHKILVAFSGVLDDLTHDQIFTNLVIGQINSYYERSRAWFKTLVTRAQIKEDGRTLKEAARLAEGGDVCECAQKVRTADPRDRKALLEEENFKIIAASTKMPLDPSDLNADRKTLSQLCLMYSSMKWLALKLTQLRRVTERANDSSLDGDGDDLQGPPVLKRSLTAAMEQADADEYSSVYLPLTRRSAGVLEGIITGFHDLADLALRTLHLELRCDIILTVSPLFKGNYILTDPVEAADEDVLKLVEDMSIFDRIMRGHLQPEEYSYIVDGCSNLADSILINNAIHEVKNLNAVGAEHLELNARVLYHNMVNMESKADLPRCFEMFRLFDEGPNAIIAHAWKGKLVLSHEQLKAIVELWHSEALEGKDQNKASRAEKQMAEQLVQLSEALSRG